MRFESTRQELANAPLNEEIRSTATAVVDWLEGLPENTVDFITVRRVIDRLKLQSDHQRVLAALYVLTQLNDPALCRGVYWTDEEGNIREMEADLYADALVSGALAHPDYGTTHTDFMNWVHPFFWVPKTRESDTAGDHIVD